MRQGIMHNNKEGLTGPEKDSIAAPPEDGALSGAVVAGKAMVSGPGAGAGAGAMDGMGMG